MRHNLKIIAFLLPIVVSFTGCQYELSGDFKRDISKPDASHPADITLSLYKDTIIIYGTTDVKYSVSSFGLNCNGIEINYLDTKINNNFDSSGSFTMTPDFTNTNWFDLTAKFYLSSGTGSVADKFKLENYVGTKTWKVLYVDPTTHDFHLQYHVNSDGVLEVFWIKPAYLSAWKSKVIKYINEIQPTKVSGDTIFYADKDYCGGPEFYSLRFQLGDQNFSNNLNINPNYPFPVFTITSIGLDSCLVSWTPSEIKRYYKLDGYYTGYNNSFRDQCLRGDQKTYELYTYPPNYLTAPSWSSNSIWTFYNSGVKAGYRFTYSYLKDQFVLSESTISPALTKSDFTLPAFEFSMNGSGWEYQLYGNNQGTQFVGFLYGIIHVFDENLNEKNTITVGTSTDSYYNMEVTDNGCFAYINDNKTYDINNIGSDPSWHQFSFKPNFNDNALGSASITVDGHYVIWRGNSNFYIYDVSDHQNAKIVYTSPSGQVFSAKGNPLNKNEMFVGATDKIEVRTCPDFQLIKQISLPGVGNISILNVDTYNNSLLVCSTKHFHIINLNTMKEVLRFGANNVYSYGYLYRNQFFINSTKTDLSPFIKRP